MTTISDLEIMAKTVWGESRGDGPAGMEAVAHVILNRAEAAQAYIKNNDRIRHPLFGNGTITHACKARWQFSCWNDDDPNLDKMARLTLGDSVFCNCIQAALKVIMGAVDFTGGALHYYAKSMKKPPAWHKGEKPSYETLQHIFFNNIK